MDSEFEAHKEALCHLCAQAKTASESLDFQRLTQLISLMLVKSKAMGIPSPIEHPKYTPLNENGQFDEVWLLYRDPFGQCRNALVYRALCHKDSMFPARPIAEPEDWLKENYDKLGDAMWAWVSYLPLVHSAVDIAGSEACRDALFAIHAPEEYARKKAAASVTIPVPDPNPEAPADWFTVTVAADMAGVTPSAISKACEAGHLEFIGKGRERRISPESLASYMACRKAAIDQYYID